MDGKLVDWTRRLARYGREIFGHSWSSPGLSGKDGKTYAVFCDYNGDLHLFDPRTGKDLDVISLGRNIESSPAVYNDMIVVGSYTPKIYGVRIK